MQKFLKSISRMLGLSAKNDETREISTPEIRETPHQMNGAG